jgi:hypothetical protein
MHGVGNVKSVRILSGKLANLREGKVVTLKTLWLYLREEKKKKGVIIAIIMTLKIKIIN